MLYSTIVSSCWSLSASYLRCTLLVLWESDNSVSVINRNLKSIVSMNEYTLSSNGQERELSKEP